MAIMIDLQPILRQMYIHYFEVEQMAAKSKEKFNLSELRRASLVPCF